MAGFFGKKCKKCWNSIYEAEMKVLKSWFITSNDRKKRVKKGVFFLTNLSDQWEKWKKSIFEKNEKSSFSLNIWCVKKVWKKWKNQVFFFYSKISNQMDKKGGSKKRQNLPIFPFGVKNGVFKKVKKKWKKAHLITDFWKSLKNGVFLVVFWSFFGVFVTSNCKNGVFLMFFWSFLGPFWPFRRANEKEPFFEILKTVLAH